MREATATAVRDDRPAAGRPVVVGVDGSRACLIALEWALREAGARRAPLRVVTVFAWDRAGRAGAPTQRDGRARRTAHDRQAEGLARALARVGQQVATAVRSQGLTTELATGDPASTLIERSSDADLLVLASHGERGVQPLLGSVAEVCIRHSSCPVVVVPATEQPVLTSREAVLGGP